MKRNTYPPHTLSLALAFTAALSACGTSTAKGKKGFFSDVNICKPIALPDSDPTSLLSGHFAIPVPTGGVVQTAQLTAVEDSTKSVWGAQLYVSSALEDGAALTITPLVKHKDGLLDTSVGPDATPAGKPFLEGGDETISLTTTPSWVSMQFAGVIEVKAGDAIWLTTKAAASGSKDAFWWYTAGDGAYVAPLNVPLYAKIPSVQALYRLIYCE